MKVQVGIDLGTTNTVCCWIEDGKERFVKFGGKDTLPSVLMFQNGQTFIGEVARRRAIQFPHQFIRSAKTHIGDDTWIKEIDGRTFNATDVATEVLRYVREELIRQRQLPQDVITEAVITVPAYFKAKQREETKLAGEQAGFVVKSIVQEPVAAALADTAKRQEREKLFVLDLGGGTFDVSILQYTPNKSEVFQIDNIDGDSRLGGDNFDEGVREWLYGQIAMQTGINLRNDNCGIKSLEITREKLQKLAEDLKIELSIKPVSTKKMSNLFIDEGGKSFNLEVTMTREQFEQQCAKQFKKIEKTINRCLKDVSLEPNDIQRILLVGGSSQMPKIHEIIQRIFGIEPHKNRDLSKIVAAGAALLALNHEGMSEKIATILPHTLGIEVVRDGIEGKMQKMLKRGEKYPVTFTQTFTTSVDYAESISIKVFEGEEDDIALNDFYGSLILSGIEKAVKGVPQITITFTFDRNGILHVHAKDLVTNVEMSEQIKIDKQGVVSGVTTPTNIALMIDTSGSMRKDNKMLKAQNAATTLVNEQLDLTNHYVAIIGFADSIKIEASFTQDKKKLHDAINRLTPKGGTHLEVVFPEMQYVFKNAPCNSHCIILVTDGRTSNEKTAIERVQVLKEQNIRIVAIGVGGDVKEDYLRNIATSASDCFSIMDMDELTDVFAKVSSTLSVVN